MYENMTTEGMVTEASRIAEKQIELDGLNHTISDKQMEYRLGYLESGLGVDLANSKSYEEVTTDFKEMVERSRELRSEIDAWVTFCNSIVAAGWHGSLRYSHFTAEAHQ